jgi:hypothetical protein
VWDLQRMRLKPLALSAHKFIKARPEILQPRISLHIASRVFYVVTSTLIAAPGTTWKRPRFLFCQNPSLDFFIRVGVVL